MNPGVEIDVAATRVLIVDDEPHNRELLKIMLASDGFIILTATSGDEALTIAARELPDIILLDVMMPGMDGYHVVTKLKANPDTVNIPVILVSALNDRRAKMAGLNAGAEDFLSKPVDRAELQARMRNLLRLKAYSDHHRQHGLMLEGEVAARTAALVASEQRYRQIVESTSDGIVKLDVASSIVFANQRFADMLGYDLSELLGQNAFSFLDLPEHPIANDALARRRDGVAETYELTFRRKDGEVRALSLASTPIHDDQGRYAGALATARDVTEQKQLMAQLTVSDRMASIGTLAAGVAHEINNPLACVMANLELAENDVLKQIAKRGFTAEFDDVREELRDARDASERIRTIVHDLRIFSRTEDDQTGPVDLQRVLESTLRMAWNEIRHRARLVKRYATTPPVEASEARLGQVFLNLVVNAAQAIAEGHAKTNEIRISTSVDPKGDVVIEIADTGPGMPASVLRRLFTPFFTTKPAGVGTGLGLSICHRIITSFGGSIDVTSEVGTGTTFRIVLPPAHASPPAQALEEPPEVVARRRGRVLVVDDDPMVAKAVQRTLAAEHEVVALSSADEAFARIAAGERFDVILCDLMMPQMTGMDLHAGLTRVVGDQAAKMIFLTGGAFTPRARVFLDSTAHPRVEKPFDVRQLRALINDRVR